MTDYPELMAEAATASVADEPGRQTITTFQVAHQDDALTAKPLPNRRERREAAKAAARQINRARKGQR